ncbi:sensor histidine kinase [Fontivita pretiosa]|uniref:sensor histidine kinase n=1 Tax=Fontivita pretiosa TaxID=2989684 RepID=UPI003D186F92
MINPPMDELRLRPMPELAGGLRARKAVILSRWRDAVRALLPQADEMTRRQLENSLPALLDRIADALGSDDPARTDRLIDLSPAHGEARFHQDFSLNQLLMEYAVLRRVVIQELSRALGRDLHAEESVALHQGIDVALRQAAVAFADFQRAAIERETAAMSKFLSFVSHDLRGGLNGAVLMIEVLKRELSRQQQFAQAVEDLDVVRRSVLDTVRTMERFLYAERLRLGRMPVRVAEFNVKDVLAELRRIFEYQLRDEQIELQTFVDPPELRLQSDRQLVTIVVQNLVSNGLKYGRRQPVTVRAIGAAGGALPSEVACRVAVADRGPGIAPERMQELFRPYVRGETYGQQGTGLGLFIARQAAELLGARLWAESEPGKGTTFYLDLAAPK